MANSNTIAKFGAGTTRGQIPTLTLATATETALLVNTDTGTTTCFLVPPSGGIVGSSQSFIPGANKAQLQGSGQQYGPGQAVARPYFDSTSFDLGRPFNVHLFGTGSAVANAGNTLTITLRVGTSATPGSNTSLAVPISAVATASSATLNFNITATCFWDSTSGDLSCVSSSNLCYNGVQTYTALAHGSVVTGITTPAGLSFSATVTWGNAVGGVIAATEFSLERI